jgi:hypothetical protein
MKTLFATHIIVFRRTEIPLLAALGFKFVWSKNEMEKKKESPAFWKVGCRRPKHTMRKLHDANIR